MQRAVTVPASASEAGPLSAFAEPDRLPARIALAGEGGEAGVAEICRDRVVIRREDDAERPTVVAPLSVYRGVAVTILPADGGAEPVFHVFLHHGDPALVVPLATGTALEAIAEAWRAWARVFGLPMLAIDQAGNVHGALHQIGAFFAAPPSPRRRGSGLVGRRSRTARRRTVPASRERVVIRGAREIIARD